MERLRLDFYKRPADLVARDLLGKLLVRKVDSRFMIGKIVETEAYLSSNDSASHGSRSQTKRNQPMFGQPGFAYIYLIYGVHYCFNIVTEEVGKPSAVLIRALEPIYPRIDKEKTLLAKSISSGPGKLTRWMSIDRKINEENLLTSDRFFVTDRIVFGSSCFASELVRESQVTRTKRIGVDYSKDANLSLRFYIKGNDFISKP